MKDTFYFITRQNIFNTDIHTQNNSCSRTDILDYRKFYSDDVIIKKWLEL